MSAPNASCNTTPDLSEGRPQNVLAVLLIQVCYLPTPRAARLGVVNHKDDRPQEQHLAKRAMLGGPYRASSGDSNCGQGGQHSRLALPRPRSILHRTASPSSRRSMLGGGDRSSYFSPCHDFRQRYQRTQNLLLGRSLVSLIIARRPVASRAVRIVDSEPPAVNLLLLQRLHRIHSALDISEVSVRKTSGLTSSSVNGNPDINDISDATEKVAEVTICHLERHVADKEGL